MTALRLSQVRLSSAGSRAGYFQKLLTSGPLRDFLMSSNTARTFAGALAYSTGCGWLMRSSMGLATPTLVDLDARARGGQRRREAGQRRREEARTVER